MRSAAPQSEGPGRAVPALAAPAGPALQPPRPDRAPRRPRGGLQLTPLKMRWGGAWPPAPRPQFGRTLLKSWLKVFGNGVRRDGRGVRSGAGGGGGEEVRGQLGGVLGLGASRPKAEGFQNLGETKDISNEAGILQ